MAEEKLSLEKRKRIVRLMAITGNVSETARRMGVEFGLPAPTRKTVARINKLFEDTGSVVDPKRPGRHRTMRTEANRARLAAELASSPGKSKSIRRLSARLNIERRTVGRLLHDMKFSHYRPRLLHALNEDDFDRRMEFAQMWLNKLQEDPDLVKRVVWTDEAKFHVSGTVNRHNCVFWRENNPHVTFEVEHQSPGVMVWGAVKFDGLLGPFFFDGSVTGESYLDLLQGTVIPLLAARNDFNDLWWQQDGAPPHYAVIVRDFLDQTFPDRWIGRRGPVEWPPRSPDITPPDFFLWGYIKDKVYAHSIQNVHHLKQVIEEEFNAVPVAMCRKACENVALRLQACIDVDGAQVDYAMETR